MKVEAVVPQYRAAPAPQQFESLVDSVHEMAETEAYNQAADEGGTGLTRDLVLQHAIKICQRILGGVDNKLKAEQERS